MLTNVKIKSLPRMVGLDTADDLVIDQRDATRVVSVEKFIEGAGIALQTGLEGLARKDFLSSNSGAESVGTSTGATVEFRLKGTEAKYSEIKADIPWLSPENYDKEAGTGGDDSASLRSAFLAASTMGLNVKLSKKYKSSEDISLSNFYGDVFGNSQSQSGITFSDGKGIVVDNSGTTVVRKPFSLRSLHIKSTGLRTGTALNFTGNGGIRYAKQLILRDVDISSADDGNYAFDTCFKLVRAGQSIFDTINVSGAGTSQTTSMMGKIFDTFSCKNVNIVDSSFQNFDTFAYVHDDSEGFVVEGNHIIAGRRGFVSSNNTGNAMWIVNNHFNTTLSAVELGDGSTNGGNHSVIQGNFCIVFNDVAEDATTPYIGIDVCSNFNTIQGNQILRTATSKDATAIRLRANTAGTRVATANTVSENIGNQLSRNIVLDAGVSNNNVFGNTRIGISLLNDIIDNGTNTRYWIMESDGNRFMTKDIKLCDTGKASARSIGFYSSTDPNVATAQLRVSGGVAGVGNDGTGEFTGATLAVKALRSSSDNVNSNGAISFRWASTYSTRYFIGAGNVSQNSGAGSPEGSITAVVGSTFQRSDGGAGTCFYVKESGTGNTGWVAK